LAVEQTGGYPGKADERLGVVEDPPQIVREADPFGD
jgi:hypothetical protein